MARTYFTKFTYITRSSSRHGLLYNVHHLIPNYREGTYIRVEDASLALLSDRR
jgi:hypothetical protein